MPLAIRVPRATRPSTTAAAADTTPPTISAVQATPTGGNRATIIWTTSEAADSQVEYRKAGTRPTRRPRSTALW